MNAWSTRRYCSACNRNFAAKDSTAGGLFSRFKYCSAECMVKSSIGGLAGLVFIFAAFVLVGSAYWLAAFLVVLNEGDIRSRDEILEGQLLMGIFALGLLMVATGLGLLRRRPWARIVTICFTSLGFASIVLLLVRCWRTDAALFLVYFVGLMIPGAILLWALQILMHPLARISFRQGLAPDTLHLEQDGSVHL
jgi:hypothetical protein